MLKVIYNKWFQIGVILLLPFLAYLNILRNNFVWDDIGFIRDWDIPRNFANFTSFLNGSAPIGFEGAYRPIKIIILSLNLHFFGYTNALMFHFQGIMLHLAITLLIYFIIKKLTKEPILALITSLLFGLSPVHTEAIAFATASLDLFGILFILVSYLVYLYSNGGENKKLFILSLFFATLAYFSNELTFPFFLLLISTDYFIFKKKLRISREGLIYFWYLLPVLAYFFIRFVLLHIASRQQFVISKFIPTMFDIARTFVDYAKAVVFPLNLTALPVISPRNIGFYKASGADSMVILGILIMALLIIAVFYFRKKAAIISFSASWILITYIPFSNITQFGITYSERYLYFASFGFYLAVGYVFFRLLNSKFITNINKKVIFFLLVIVLSLYFVRTIVRNNDWHDSISLWQKTLVLAPNNPDVYNNLGVSYLQKGELELALKTIKKAIEINSNYPLYYDNLGSVYYAKQDYANALAYWSRASSLGKTNEIGQPRPQKHNLMGNAYLQKGDFSRAESEFMQAISVNNKDVASYNGLALVYLQKKDLAKALSFADKALEVDPNNAQAKQTKDNIQSYFQQNLLQFLEKK